MGVFSTFLAPVKTRFCPRNLGPQSRVVPLGLSHTYRRSAKDESAFTPCGK